MYGHRRTALLALSVGVIAGISILVLNASTPYPPTAVGCGLCDDGLFAFSGSTDSSSGTESWYNLTIEEVSPTTALGNIAFELESPTGSPIPPPESGLNIVQIDGPIEASYAFGQQGAYQPGFSASTPLTTSDLISVFLHFSPENTSLAGYTLWAYLPDGICSGPIT